MHIGFITKEYPELTSLCGGLGTSLKTLAEALVQNNISVSVFLFNHTKDSSYIHKGINFYFIKKRNYYIATWLFNRKHFQKRVQKIVDAEKIDLVESPDWAGITAFMKFTVPLVIRLHGSDTFFCYLEKRKQKLKHFIYEKLTVRHADGLIAPTSFAAKISAQLFNIKNQDIKVIHYGIPLNDFNNNEPLNFEPGLILYYGSIVRKKGIFELPEIFREVLREVPQAKLLLVGRDCRDQESGRLSTWDILQGHLDEDMKEKITYVSSIPYNAVRTYIQRANVCVFPSFAETLGMVIIESMAMKKAVVTSNLEWSREIIDDGLDGFLVKPKENREFAKKIIELIKNSDLTSKTGTDALEKVCKKFDILKITKENIEYYRQTILLYKKDNAGKN